MEASTLSTPIASSSSPQHRNNSVTDLVESRQYQAALVLNNIGISLLEAEAYTDAVITLRNAFQLIRNLVPQKGDGLTNSYDSPETVARINSDFQIAYEQLRKCQKSSQTTAEGQQQQQDDESKKKKNSSTSIFYDFTVLKDDCHDEMYEAATSYPIRNNGYVIRINASGEEYYTNLYLLQSSVIMMNYAVAYRCQISIPMKGMSKAKREMKYINFAHKLFTVAYELLTHEAFQQQQNADTIDPIVLGECSYSEQIELTRILVVQGLMHMSYDLNLIDEGQRYYSLLGDLHLGHEKPASTPRKQVRTTAAAA